jgi:diguanylate cyclase (GGDEF)-like protein
VLDSDLASAEAQMARMKKWVLGDYTIQLAEGTQAKVKVDASIGVSQWRPGESLRQVIERADSAMYQEKKQGKQAPSDSARN